MSQQDIKDIEKGIEEQRRKEEEEKRQKEEEEAREQAAGEEENNATPADNEQNNNINNHNNGAVDQHQGHGHQQQQNAHQPQQPVVNGAVGNNGLVNNGYPPNQYQGQVPQQNLVNHVPNNQVYPNQPAYPVAPPQNGYQNPNAGVVPNFAQIPVHPGGQVNQHHQQQPQQPQQPNYLPGVQQIAGGLYPNSPVNNLPPTQIHQQQPFSPTYPGTGQGPLTPPSLVTPQVQQQTPQLTPQQVPGYTPGTVGGYPAVNSLHHQQNNRPQAQPVSPVSNQYPQQQQPPAGPVNPLGQLNPALLNQLNPALLQQYGQQLRNGGGFNPLVGQLNPTQLNQLNQLARGLTQGNQGPGQQNSGPPSPLSPFNGLSAFTPLVQGRGPGSPPGLPGQPGSPNQPASIGSLLRGAGRALGIPGFAAGSNTLAPQGTPYSTESPFATSTPNYGAIRNNAAAREPQAYDRSQGSYNREDDRRNPYPSQGRRGEDDRSSVDYEDDRNGNSGQRSPYREKYERTRGNGRDRPADRFSSYGRVKDEVRRDRDYGNDYRAGVEYNPNDLNENDHANYNRDIPSRPRAVGYGGDDERSGVDYPPRRTFRDQMGNQMHRQYPGYNNRERSEWDRSKPGRFDDDEGEVNRNRANPFLAG